MMHIYKTYSTATTINETDLAMLLPKDPHHSKNYYSVKDNSRKWEDKPKTRRECLQLTHMMRTVVQNVQRTLKTQQ
jgi:hypothetical protein